MEGKGRAPMGSRKHGVSGHPGVSLKLRQNMRREAERHQKKKLSSAMYGSVTAALKGEKGKP